MTDLSHIDSELGALGAPRADIANLVKRYGEEDRSLARVDDALLALGAGVTLTGFAAPVVPRATSRDDAAREPAEAHGASASKARARNLLDDELDPSEFPQTVPPPPPVEAGGTERPDATEEGFELLVDDADILDDDDTQVSYEQE